MPPVDTAMDFLLNISPLVKLVVIFFLIIVLIRQRLSLGIALIAGSILLGLWFRLSPLEIGASIIGSLSAQRTVSLCAVVTLILILSHSMEKTGQMKRLLISFRGIRRNVRLNLAIFPALIGLLPMPGGAIFSAPMVHEISNRESLSAKHKTLINYWFRHIWEFSWPLYPGVILTCALSGIDLWAFVLAQFPLTLFAAWIGYLTQLRSIPIKKHSATSDSNKSLRDFIGELMPIIFVVAGTVLFGVLIYIASIAWPPLRSTRKEVPLIAALIISIAWVWRRNRMAFADMQRTFFNRSLLSMIFMIAGIMLFQGILEDSRAVSEVSQILASAHVPVILVAMILPLLVGGITGITVAFVGTTFPIIFSLLAEAGMVDQIFAFTILAFCAGYVGVLLSPLHICLVLTCSYFKIDLARIYPRLLFPCATVAAAGILSFMVNQFMTNS
ncbi:MAG: DUF401 family protein [Desulfobacterales bacterium]|nr:DUF401 family protein [Desulfobacterales bacterium]